MLFEFIVTNRDDIIRRCRAKVARRSIPPPTEAEIDYGVPVCLDQLIDTLNGQTSDSVEINKTALQHGHDLLLRGFTVSQGVHDYGDVCQAITDLAVETDAPIAADDFRTLNRCLDDAIASAVTEYGRARNAATVEMETARDNERLGFFAHELPNLTNTSMMAFEVLRTGNVAVGGSTGTVLHRSLLRTAALIDRSMAEVRLTEGVQNQEPLLVAELIKELTPSMDSEADAKGIVLNIVPGGGWCGGQRRSPDLGRGGWELAAERIQVHSAPEPRDIASWGERRTRAHRSPGRVWRPPAKGCGRLVPALRTAKR